MYLSLKRLRKAQIFSIFLHEDDARSVHVLTNRCAVTSCLQHSLATPITTPISLSLRRVGCYQGLPNAVNKRRVYQRRQAEREKEMIDIEEEDPHWHMKEIKFDLQKK